MNRKRMPFKIPLLLVYVSISFVSCFELPDELVVPQWQVDLNVPVLNKIYTLDELLNDDPHITIDTSGGNSIYILQSETFGLNSGVDEFMQITEQTSSQYNPVPASDSDSTIAYVEFSEGTELDSAVFDDGYLSIFIFNPSPYRADIIISIPGIILPEGSGLVFNIGIEPFRTDSIKYNLRNHTYLFPDNQPLDKKNNLQIIGKVHSLVPDETIILASYYISDFYFKSISGLLPSKSLGNREETFSFQMDETEEYHDRVTLREAQLRLEATYFAQASNPVGVEIRRP